jgi:thymidylate synthase (FAD)
MKFTSEIDVRVIQQCGSDATIAGAAWVSTTGLEASTKAAEDPAKVAGLIRYLMQHKHGSPFEHGLLTLYVHAPIFVWREWHRHRHMSFNEESGRYKTLDPVFYVPARDRPMMKVDGWKPGRPKFLPVQDGTSVYGDLRANLELVYDKAYQAYLNNLALGIDPGLARDCLPVGIYSACWVTANPRSLMHFLSLRTNEPDAKHVSYPLYEIDYAARKVESAFAKYWPDTHAAWVSCGRVAP